MKAYKTPTEDAAIARETVREKLRKKYDVREGDVIRMKIDTNTGSCSGDEKKVIKRVRVVEIEPHNITVRIPHPSDYNMSFGWWDFERRRLD